MVINNDEILLPSFDEWSEGYIQSINLLYHVNESKSEYQVSIYITTSNTVGEVLLNTI